MAETTTLPEADSSQELAGRLPQGLILPPELRPDMTDEELKRLLGVQVVDVSEGVAAHAVDAAEQHINHETSGKNFLKKIWTGNIARDFIRQRHIQKGRKEIMESGNLYALHGGSQLDHEQATDAIVDRFQEEHLQSGEKSEQLTATGPGSELAQELRTAVRAFSRSDGGQQARADLEEARKLALGKYGDQVRGSERNKGLLFATDIVKVAEHGRAAVAHGIGLDRVEAALHVKLGDAKVGAQTQAKYNAVDKFIDKVYSTKVGSWVNETTLAVGAGIAISAAKWTTRSVATAAGAFVGMGVGAGVVGAVREHLHFAQDRSTNMREMAEGGQINTVHGKRRAKLEETAYVTLTASEVLTGLENVSRADPSDANGLLNLINTVSNAQLRLDKSAEERIDLIRYSSKTELENERRDIYIGLAQAKVVLRRALQTADPSIRNAAKVTSQDVDEVIRDRSATLDKIISGDISDRNKAFRNKQLWQSVKMGGISAASSIAMGLFTQEVRAAVMDTVRGVFESVSKGANRETLLAGIFHGGGQGGGSGAEHLVKVNGHTQVNVPDGFNLAEHTVGHAHEWQLKDAHNHIVDGNVTFDKDGQLSAATKHVLEQKGFKFSDKVTRPTVPGWNEHVTRTPKEYILAHPHQFKAIDRELWYDNNTPNVYDHNELKLWWGGANNTGIDANGNYVFNVGHMTNDGSYHDGLSAHANELMREGKLKAGIVLPGHEGHAYMLKVDRNGNVVINKDSYFGRSLFSVRDGHAQYANKDLLEIYQNMGTRGGAEHVRVLATEVGSGPPAHAAQDIIPHGPHTVVNTVNTIEAPAGGLPIEVPFVLPLYGRKGLEDLTFGPEGPIRRRPEETGPTFLPMYYGGRDLESMREWIRQDPNRLRTRREVLDRNGQKMWVEADGTLVERNVGRERATIRGYLEGQKINDPDYYARVEQVADFMAPMDDACRVALNVPAWMEEKNLRTFLEQFTSQVNADGARLAPEMYEVNVLINRRTGTPADNSVGVINDFIRDFEAANGFKPKVNYFDVEIDPPNNNVGYARKLLTDAAMLRSIRRNGQAASLYIESEDADINRADPKTVFNLIEKLDANPHLDAVRGVQDRDPDFLQQNDMLFIRRRIWDFAETLARSKKFRDPTRPNWNYTWNRNWLSGWNTGYSAEAYALAGGYDNTTVAEDMILGERMTMLRGDGTNPNLEVIGRIKTRANGSPRRFIMEIKDNQDAYAPGRFENEDLNKRLRQMSNDELLGEIKQYERISPDNAGAFSGLVGAYINGFIPTVTGSPEEADQMSRRLLFWLGFKPEDYEINDGTLTIKSFDNLKDALGKYRQRHTVSRRQQHDFGLAV